MAGVDSFIPKRENVMKILWAVSSVGKGHVVRDMAIVSQLESMVEVEVEWLAPYPAEAYLADHGHRVLECSSQLRGSGRVYGEVLADSTDEFNLLDYVRADTKLHQQDFEISTQCWHDKRYDVIVGDEAFWLLAGFSTDPSVKPAPFVFLTDFIGTKAMRPRVGDWLCAWRNNFYLTMSHRGPDEYIYIGAPEEIPDEKLGFRLPSRRGWAQRHCRFVKPVVRFDPDKLADKRELREQLGLPEAGYLFLAVVGGVGNNGHRVTCVERAFDRLKTEFPEAYFVLVGPESGAKAWIEYHRYVENLYTYFAASDVAIIQAGYGKAVELSSLGIPFIAIPLDYHFEQEYVMGHRLKHYGVGKVMALRHYTPEDIAREVKKSINKRAPKIPVDNGSEIGTIILEAADFPSPRY